MADTELKERVIRIDENVRAIKKNYVTAPEMKLEVTGAITTHERKRHATLTWPMVIHLIATVIVIPETRTAELRNRERLRQRWETQFTPVHPTSILNVLPKPIFDFATLLFLGLLGPSDSGNPDQGYEQGDNYFIGIGFFHL